MWSVIELQRLTGARAGEILGLTRGMIDVATWSASLGDHKTAHLGKTRVLRFGPRAQAILGPLMLRPDDARLFPRHTTASYRRAIARACDRADRWAKGGKIIGNDVRIGPRWHPHQLRHTAATEIRRQFGLEAAQVVLGHSSARVTDAVYAERDGARVDEIMRQIG